MGKKIELVDIVRGQDFLREIHRAASLSHEHKRETGFNVYCDEQLSQPYVNRAVLGHDTSIETDMTQEVKHEPQNGFHIPMYNYRLLGVHFHPPNSNLRPSAPDIKESLNARRVNVNLRESDSQERDVYGDKEKTKLIGYEIDFPNPVSMVGLVRDKPENIELLVYQGTTEDPISFDRFSKFVVDFLNESNYLQAVAVKIRDGGLSDKDLEKLRKFQLIQTRFFPNETYHSYGDWMDSNSIQLPRYKVLND